MKTSTTINNIRYIRDWRANAAQPLYYHYSGQYNAQPAYIEIDPAALNITADYSGVIGNAVPEAVWNGRIVRVMVHSSISGRDLTALFNDESFHNLVERIIAGHETFWNGSNYVGRDNDDASEALYTLSGVIAQIRYEAEAKEIC